MLSVILLILKIIGIVLLCLLGLLLFLILLVLLVPVRYRGKAAKEEAIVADVNATWLLHLVHVIVSYGEEGLVKKIKIFGFTLKDKDAAPKKKEEKEESTEEKTEEKKETEEHKESSAEDNKTEVKEETNTEAKTEVKAETKNDEKAEIKAEVKSESETSQEIKEETKEETKEDDKLPDHKIGKKKKSKKKTDIAEKLNNLYNKLVHYKEIIDDPRFRNGIRYGLNRVLAILKHILPRKLKGYAHYGFDDPSTTGYITAAVGATYGLFNDFMKFEPDFENAVLEGNIEFRGHARLGTVLFIALQVILKKDCRFVYKTIKAEGND